MTTKKRMIELAHERGDFYVEADGYYYWEPKGSGCLGAKHLRWLADELDKLNAAWDREVKAELARTAAVQAGDF